MLVDVLFGCMAALRSIYFVLGAVFKMLFEFLKRAFTSCVGLGAERYIILRK
jgi:hypothetical protein